MAKHWTWGAVGALIGGAGVAVLAQGGPGAVRATVDAPLRAAVEVVGAVADQAPAVRDAVGKAAGAVGSAPQDSTEPTTATTVAP